METRPLGCPSEVLQTETSCQDKLVIVIEESGFRVGHLDIRRVTMETRPLHDPLD